MIPKTKVILFLNFYLNYAYIYVKHLFLDHESVNLANEVLLC